MQYLFKNPMPAPWLLADLLTILVSLYIIIFIASRSKHPAAALLECFTFTVLYASVYENFAVGQGWYFYGRSLMMIGDVPFSVPLIEMDVLFVSLWLLEKMDLPVWCKPFFAGLMGILQDFSLDPHAVRQVFSVNGLTSGRWTWVVPHGNVNIYHIPVYNFPGWTLIMAYAVAWLLLGRWWYKRSGYKPVVGYVYPFLTIFAALLTMVSPLSQFLLWLAPFSTKGSSAEWIMLAVHLLVPVVLLVIFWRGRMKSSLSFKADLPVFIVVGGFHLADILFTVAGGYSEVLWLVLLASLAHWGLIAAIYLAGRKVTAKKPVLELAFEP